MRYYAAKAGMMTAHARMLADALEAVLTERAAA
jgi:hypothetical protein